jgi:hypothetical protein
MYNKRIFLLFILLLAGLINQAQTESTNSKFYVKVYGGYGLLQPGSYKLNSVISAGDLGSTEQSKQGLGSGIRFGGGVGVIASDFLNIGVDAEYLSGTDMSSTSSFINAPYYYTKKTTVSYTSLSITPNIVFKALSKPDYLIYNKLGILLNLPMELKWNQQDSNYTTGKPDEDYNYKITGAYKFGLTVGLNVALGVQYRLTDNIRAYGEIFGNYLVLLPETYDDTNETTIGKAPTSTLINHDTYIKSGQTSYSRSGNTITRVTSVEGYTFNMNAIGINIGIAFRF